MSALVQETLIAVSKARQADLVTPTAALGLMRLKKLNADLANFNLTVEDDSQWIGKNHEFAERGYQTAWDVTGKLEKINSIQFTTWALAFALGETDGAGNYTIIDSSTTGIDQPAFTYVEQIRPGSNVVLDRKAVGCCIEDIALSVKSGPSLTSSTCQASFVGTGKFVTPSAITMPDETAEDLLLSAALTFTGKGTNYVTTKRIIQADLTWKNNMRLNTGFFPGSGFQTGGDSTTGAIRGRMEHGVRALTFKFTARFEHGSTEFTDNISQSTGTCVLGLTGANSAALSITLEKVSWKNVVVNNFEGIVSAEVDVLPLMDPTNGLISVVSSVVDVG